MNKELDHLTLELTLPLGELIPQLAATLSDQVTADMQGQLPDFASQHHQTVTDLQEIKQQIAGLDQLGKLIEHQNEITQTLGEQFYEEKVISPLVRSLFPLVDLILTARQTLRKRQPQNAPVSQYLDAIISQLDTFWAIYDIKRFSHAAGSHFDPARMKPLKMILAPEEDLVGRIAQSLQCGFIMKQRVLRFETVRLYK